MKTRDDLQTEYLQQPNDDTAIDPTAAEFYIIDERLNNLEEGLIGKPVRIVRPITKTVGGIVAAANLLSVTGMVWFRALGWVEGTDWIVGIAIFLLLAFLGAIIASIK